MEIDANILIAVLGCIVVRWSTSINPYSGYNKPPMNGDYEAQRHWMEITYHLPVSDWYHQTRDNDLQYWGLDYPPLTAYHSQAMGAISHQINSSWVKLHGSRGIETIAHKLFMRYSVIVADILVYIPAVVLFFKEVEANYEKQLLQIGTVLLYPGLILIDHGHFQYNCISLGLAIWAVLCLAKGRDLLGSIAFTMALNYKQMELYHAMPFFCYLLGKCFTGKEIWLLKLSKIGIVVISTFALCWMPFLTSTESVLQVLHRLFPFARGLYEDKVANVWCSMAVLIKLQRYFDTQLLLKMCLGATFISQLPSSLHLLLKPSFRNFKYALVNSSLAFFLFSFQVHEKSILLAAIPVCLLIGDHPLACTWFLLISTFSMLPLIIKDQLVTVYVSTMIIFSVLAFIYVKSSGNYGSRFSAAFNFLLTMSILGCGILTGTSLLLRPPPSLPDLHAVLVSTYSCAHFLMFLAYFNYVQIFETTGISEKQTTPGLGSQIEHGKLLKSDSQADKKGVKQMKSRKKKKKDL